MMKTLTENTNGLMRHQQVDLMVAELDDRSNHKTDGSWVLIGMGIVWWDGVSMRVDYGQEIPAQCNSLSELRLELAIGSKTNGI